MTALIHVQRTGFYQDLDEVKRNEYFSLTRSKFFPTIDNIYYGVYLYDDVKDNRRLDGFIERLTELKALVLVEHLPMDYDHGLQVTLKSNSFYRFCLTEHDMFDIFIMGGKLPNLNTPRIVVQLRAFGLWTRGVEEILTQSYETVVKVLADYDFKVDYCRENRIDYCYHTNAISSPSKLFREERGQVRHMHTNLVDVNIHGEVENADGGAYINKDYICLGSKYANNIRARVYDKVKEVIEMGYKGFFFELWHRHGLISAYDKWCMEYALPHKDTDWLYRARLAFYVEFGDDEERKALFQKALTHKNTTLDEIKRLADEYMPRTTAITNIEYETKRKFYYHSDKFIDAFKLNGWYADKDGERHDRERFSEAHVVPPQLMRLFKILDNRWVFLDWFTSKTLAFYSGKDKDGNLMYTDFWQRLRNTKLGVDKTDEKLLRDYAHEMDKNIVMVKLRNDLAALAVYNDNVCTGFMEDVADFLCNLNDNGAHSMGGGGLRLVNDSGEVLGEPNSPLLAVYGSTKHRKDKTLKNRKRAARDMSLPKGVDSAVPYDNEHEVRPDGRSPQNEAAPESGSGVYTCRACGKVGGIDDFVRYGANGVNCLCRDCAQAAPLSHENP